LALAPAPSSAHDNTGSSGSALEDSIEYYSLHYGLKNVFDKLVDNHGNGYEPLYGVRNFRMVLNGVAYRGGANNAYNRNGIRNNSNPLPNEGLQNLCEEGFSEAVYLYPTRYSTAPKSISCRTRQGGDNTLTYLQESPLSSESATKRILQLLHRHLTDPQAAKPVYMHCWNGWHASGFISAVSLRQFCGISAEDAVDYWNKNTDGANKGSSYDKIRARIRAFKPYADLTVSDAVKARICL
jgi:hypothetical protein